MDIKELCKELEVLAQSRTVYAKGREAAYGAVLVLRKLAEEEDQTEIDKILDRYAMDVAGGVVPGTPRTEAELDKVLSEALEKSEEDIKAGRYYTLKQLDVSLRRGLKIPDDQIGETVEDFAKLVAANPGLPIMVVSNDEICDYKSQGCKTGEIGYSYIAEVWKGEFGFYLHMTEPSDILHDHKTAICDPKCEYDGDKDKLSAEETLKLYDALPWQKCIIVEINEREGKV